MIPCISVFLVASLVESRTPDWLTSVSVSFEFGNALYTSG